MTEIQKTFVKRKWWGGRAALWDPKKHKGTREMTLDAPLSDVAPFLVEQLKPGLQTLTAVMLKDGKVEVQTGSRDLEDTAKKAEKEGTSAATVKRPTPSCPQCHAGAILPATEVLLSFLDEEQHAEWAEDRSLVAIGGTTGHRYLLSHRHSEQARRQGRICYDLDDEGVIHFHDMSVPPEEEVLAAKLILEHREAWLRNEATCLGGFSNDYDYNRFTDVLKNPFGGGGDGIPDAAFSGRVGEFTMGLARGFREARYPQEPRA